MLSPQWLNHLQLVLSSVTGVCAAVGLTFAYHDWQYWRKEKQEIATLKHSATIGSFALICLVTLFYTPVRFSQILQGFELNLVAQGILRSIALTLLLVYFYVAAVRRLASYDLPPKVARRKSISIFLGMILLAVAGFYGR